MIQERCSFVIRKSSCWIGCKWPRLESALWSEKLSNKQETSFRKLKEKTEPAHFLLMNMVSNPTGYINSITWLNYNKFNKLNEKKKKSDKSGFWSLAWLYQHWCVDTLYVGWWDFLKCSHSEKTPLTREGDAVAPKCLYPKITRSKLRPTHSGIQGRNYTEALFISLQAFSLITYVTRILWVSRSLCAKKRKFSP